MFSVCALPLATHTPKRTISHGATRTSTRGLSSGGNGRGDGYMRGGRFFGERGRKVAWDPLTVSWNREVSPSLYSRIREISASEQRQKWTFQSDDDEAPELGARSRRSRKTPAIVKQQMPLKQRPPLPRAPRDEWDVAAEVERRHGGHCERIEDWHEQQWQQLDEGFDSDYY
mmetsp:Transcript_18640/g.57892  ORF Transcript_18640/g.57892 Transcript_18640/m.57892 type:complete len:172 (-) Transcript_18640:1149-1664(-)